MQSRLRAIRNFLADRPGRTGGRRSGLTLTEVLLALGVFMVGSVGIIGLFVTASIMHAEAGNRRVASFVTNELLARVKNMRFRDVYARTTLATEWLDPSATLDAVRVTAALNAQAANFNEYPLSDLFFPLRADQDLTRDEGPLLVGGEWFWYTQLDLGAQDFIVTRDPWGNSIPTDVLPVGAAPDGTDDHPADSVILQPRTWYYVLNTDILADDVTIPVDGNPANNPSAGLGGLAGAPPDGYIVVDEEWMHYNLRNGTEFTIDGDGPDDDLLPDGRGVALSTAVDHRAGTPVTVAREHESYPNFWYSVQFYPTQPNGAEAQVVVSVAYKTQTAMRAWTLRSIYTPKSF
jgi:hypothetical protein